MSKEIVLDALKHKENARPPWVVFAGIHAGLLKDYNAIEILTDASKLYDSLEEVNKLYQPDG
ncbi:MAG: uroporphyrinogen decarboxylase, partial [Candidatus Izimaplasma sp.]|nr:uroporphyrinogen decarboxylase [Candidatus Izimaplasma bacterium]